VSQAVHDPTARSPLSGVAAGRYVIDPVHSWVGFSVRHLMSRVRGRFSVFSGEIVVAERPERSTVTAVIDLTSVNTGTERRDDHLRSIDFFDVERTPTMTFTSTGLREAGGVWLLSGDLTVRDVTRPIEFEVEFLGQDPTGMQGEELVGGLDPTGLQGEPRIGFEARTAITRSDFGVSFGIATEGNKVVMGDKVDIHLEVEAMLLE
jgi:polyisoprenoid-binding protein YceI